MKENLETTADFVKLTADLILVETIPPLNLIPELSIGVDRSRDREIVPR